MSQRQSTSAKHSKQVQLKIELGEPCNTPPQSSQRSAKRGEKARKTDTPDGSQVTDALTTNAMKHPMPECIPGGFDTIHVSFSGHWNADAWDRNEDTWNEAQARAQEDPDKGECKTPEGEPYLMTGYGEGGTGLRRRWVVKLLWGTRIGIVNRQRYNEHQVSVVVQMKSDALMTFGPQAIYDQVLGWLKAMGFQRQSESISRADPCVDLVDIEVEDFRPLLIGHIKGLHRAKKGKVFTNGTQVETIQQGKETILRIYNKLAEVSGKPDKWKILQERRWNGRIPEKATRVEWEVKREKLRKFGIKTFADLMDKQAEFVEWLAKDFVVMTAEPVDRANNNQSRCTLHALWQQVVEITERVYGMPTDILPDIKPGATSLKQDEAHTLGMLARMASRMLDTEATGEAVRSTLYNLIDRHLNKLIEITASKQMMLGYDSALGPPIDPGDIPF